MFIAGQQSDRKKTHTVWKFSAFTINCFVFCFIVLLCGNTTTACASNSCAYILVQIKSVGLKEKVSKKTMFQVTRKEPRSLRDARQEADDDQELASAR